MKLRPLFFAAGALCASVTFLHCSDDDQGTGTEPGKDASVDARPIDSAVPDTSVTPDGGGADAADAGAVDAPSDASTLDAADAGHCVFEGAADGTAKLLAIYTLPTTSLKAINPYLTDAQLAAAIANGAGTVDQPGIGSGLDYAGGCSFTMVGDRGPNADSTVKNSKIFPLPEFTPPVVKVHLDPASSAIVIDQALPLFTTAGAPVTGISNGPNDETPYPSSDAGAQPLAYNQNGLDPEDVRRLPNGDFVLAEEYSPSIVLVDGATGKVKARYVPTGVSLPQAGYPVKAILPPIFASRRGNKGFEGLALSADGKKAYAVLQAPMGDESTYGASLVNRIVELDDVAHPDTASVTGHYVVLHSPAADYPGTKQPKVYYNAAAWLAAGKLLLMERGAGRLKLFVTDLSSATNLVGQPAKGEASLDPESLEAGKGYAALGIVPASTSVVFDSNDTPTFITSPPNGAIVPDKLEGLAVLNATTVAIANDNDFGIVNVADRSRIWILRLKAPLPM
jgi:alkaline phosphatase